MVRDVALVAGRDRCGVPWFGTVATGCSYRPRLIAPDVLHACMYMLEGLVADLWCSDVPRTSSGASLAAYGLVNWVVVAARSGRPSAR
jgi:hypothetical protein